MKIGVCKVECSVGTLKFKVGHKYRYEVSLIEAYNQIFKMYKVCIDDDYSNFIEFDFNQYFYSESELRKLKIEKLKNV